MRKKALTICLIATLLIASACSSKQDASSTTPDTKHTTETSNQEKKIDPRAPYEQTVEYTTARSIDQNPQFPNGDSWEKNPWQDFVEKKLNVKGKLLWTAPSDGDQYLKKIAVNITSNDLPDIFILNGPNSYNMLKKLVDNDQVEDLTNVIKDYMTPEVKDIYAATENKAFEPVTFGGKVMAIPSVASSPLSDFVWVREDWRKKLNMPEPKTLDEVRKLSKAFTDQDPDGNGKKDTVGLSAQSEFMSCMPNLHMLDLVFNINEAYPACWVKDAEDKATWGGIAPEVKPVLQTLADMYKKGELDPQFGLIDQGKTAEGTGSGRIGIVMQPWWGPFYPLGNTMRNNPKAEWKAYPLTNNNGEVPALSTGYASDNFVVVRKGFEHPELAMKLADLNTDIGLHKYVKEIDEPLTRGSYKNSPQGRSAQYMNFGVDYPDAVFRQLNHAEEAINGKKDISQLQPDEQQLVKQLKNPDDNVDNKISYIAYKGALKLDETLKKKVIVNAMVAQTETMTTKWSYLMDLQKQSFLKIITGKESIDSFDKFVQQWKQLGGDEITDEVNDYLAKQK